MTSPIRFAGFRFDPVTGDLSGPSGSTRLQPQPAKVLSLLIARPGELVTRDELTAAVWPDTVVETDQGLNYCIRQIRAALGDEADQSRFIETLPRRGYRFVAALEPEAAPTRRPARRLARWAAGPIVALLLAAGWILTGNRGSGADPKVAVLPLVSAGGAPAWMGAANQRATDQLLLQLATADSGRLGVVGPVTTARFAADPRPHPEIGRELGVDYVLSGGVQADDSTLFVQVVRVSDGVHVYVFRKRAFGVDPDSLAAAAASGAAKKILGG
jgi:DNA-binding winged helix-turn-helix (wHTH) protein/TolB-like protein